MPTEDDDASNRGPLKWALAINFTLFVGELVAGLLSGSMGLIADSLDMLADAFVYALSLAAVGGSLVRKRRLAAWSGYLQGGLALLGLAEVVRRFVAPTGAPEVGPMTAGTWGTPYAMQTPHGGGRPAACRRSPPACVGHQAHLPWSPNTASATRPDRA